MTSNPGHLLFSGLVEEDRRKRIAGRLMSPDMYSGLGIRTMSTEAAGYNPMSYHNGSVWPHDNAMILLGLSRYCYKEEAATIIKGLMEASKSFQYQRFPELFCGHPSDVGYAVPYPTTCSPQAWSAGTSVVFLQVMLGITINALEKEIYLDPILPEGIDELITENLQIHSGILSLKIIRQKEADSIFKIEVFENTAGLVLVCSPFKEMD